MSRKIIEIRKGALHGPVRGYVNASNITSLNPFVLWDHFYIPHADGLAGFGFHGHSGVATISYPQIGDIAHEDTAGHSGMLYAGGVQIMAAGSGVLHKETVYPDEKADEKIADAFQLWVALPSDGKEMGKVEYSTAQEQDLPTVEAHGAISKVVIGSYMGKKSPIQAPVAMSYLHVNLHQHQSWRYAIAPDQTTAFIYVKSGQVKVDDVQVSEGELGVYEPGTADIDLYSLDQNAEFIIVTGKPLAQKIISNGSSIHSSTENLVTGVQQIHQLQHQMAKAAF